MNNEQKVEDIEVIDLDLDNPEDKQKLESETAGQSNYFKPEKDVTYKLILTSSKVIPVEKTFEDKTLTKYQLQIKAENAKGEKFCGIWEVGTTVMNTIVKGYGVGAVFKVTKTGTGLDTRYAIIKDF